MPSQEPKGGQKRHVTPAFLAVPDAKHKEQNQTWSRTKGNKIRSGCLTPAFSGAQKRAEMLRHPCILRRPQERGRKSEVATSPLPSRGPERGQQCYVTRAFYRVRNAERGEENQKWLPHPCLLGGPKGGKNATSPLAFSGVPIAKCGEQNQKWSPTKRSKIRSGCLTPAFSGAQKRAVMLRHPYILGGPQH